MTEQASNDELRAQISRARLERRRFAYLSLTLALGVFAAFAGAVGYVGYVNDQRDSDRRRVQQQLDEQRAAQGEQTRQIICSLALAYVRSFDAVAPAGERSEIAEAWRGLSVLFRC